jgi:hypothetical protein
MANTFGPLWLLYVDFNARINILLDDAAGLQQLVARYVDDRRTLAELLKAQQEGEPRQWILPHLAAERKLRSRDRALIEIWRMMGSSAHTMEQLRCKTRETFVSATCNADPARSGTEETHIAIANFISQRHYLITYVANNFLSQLRLAREKLQAILENRPGALPAPISQRRWASSFYVDFLGSYSFRIRRDVAYLCKTMEPRGSVTRPLAECLHQFDDMLFNEEDVFHGVGYESTSYTSCERRETREPNRPANSFSRQLTVASSYFYPEQPVLLPLLAHEFAHHYQMFVTEHSESPSSLDAWFLTMSSRVAEKIAGQLGHAKYPLPGLSVIQVSSAIDMVIHEIKADVVAFSIGGSAYVHALMLQLLGSDGSSRYQAPLDTRNDPLTTAVFDRRSAATQIVSTEVPVHIASVLRIVFCNALLEKTPDENCGFADAQEFCKSLEALLGQYLHGYLAIAESENWSSDWSDYIALIYELKPAFIEFADDLWDKFGDALKLGAQYGQGNAVREDSLFNALEATVDNYCEQSVRTVVQAGSMNSIPKFSFFRTGYCGATINTLRLEYAPLAVRWHMAKTIQSLTGIAAGLYGTDRREFQENVCDGVVNYLRNDGSVVSRYLMEYIVARRHFLREIAQSYSTSSISRTPTATQASKFCEPLRLELGANSALLKRIDDLIGAANAKPWSVRSDDEQRQAVSAWLSSVLAEESVSTPSSPTPVAPIFSDDVNYTTALTKLACSLLGPTMAAAAGCNYVPPGGAPVGMFELGSICFRVKDGCTASESGTVTRTYQRFSDQSAKAVELLNARVAPQPGGGTPFFETHTFAVLGEYNYATYLRGTTPVEKDFHVGPALPHVPKPRFIVQVSGKPDWSRKTEDYKIRAITLARLEMRHRWVALVEELTKNRSANCFLSTGWETLVIDWTCNSAQEFWETTKTLCDKADTHTVMVVCEIMPTPPQTAAAKSAHPTGTTFKQMCDNDTHNFRTGRYDYGGNADSITVKEMYKKLDAISNSEWNDTEKLSVEVRVHDHAGSGTDDKFNWILRRMIGSRR